jgi:S1-C subfamily serine protease
MDEQRTPDETPAAPQAAPVPPAFGGPRRHRRLLIGGVTALAIGAVASGAGIAYVAGAERVTASASQSVTTQPELYRPGRGYGYGSGSGNGSSSTATSATAATAAQKAGVVTIVSDIGYDGSEEAAGTGIILTADGEIVTNNHVVEGSTKITVTVQSTGASYTADVVGTDATDDIAVLQLEDASGLTTAHLDDDALAVGDSITDVGNAGGTGTLVAAVGTVAALDQQIQVADETTGAEKTLTGLVELDADVVSGDSGGPVLDSEGEVAAIATAASSGTSDVTGYAIPIATAMAVVDRIVAGDASGVITIGLPAFLGVQLSSQATSASGAAIAGVIDGMPAAQAGITAGSVITSVDGTAVADSTALSAAIAGHAVGDTVTIGWTDATGAAHSASVALVAGPAA